MDGNIDKVHEALETGLRLAHAYEDWDAEKEISEAILSLQAKGVENWRVVLEDMLDAMERYAMDTDEPAPYRHRKMMQEARTILSAEPAQDDKGGNDGR